VPGRIYLAVGGRFGADIDGGQVIRLQDASAAVDAGQVDDLLSRTFIQKTTHRGSYLLRTPGQVRAPHSQSD